MSMLIVRIQPVRRRFSKRVQYRFYAPIDTSNGNSLSDSDTYYNKAELVSAVEKLYDPRTEVWLHILDEKGFVAEERRLR